MTFYYIHFKEINQEKIKIQRIVKKKKKKNKRLTFELLNPDEISNNNIFWPQRNRFREIKSI